MLIIPSNPKIKVQLHKEHCTKNTAQHNELLWYTERETMTEAYNIFRYCIP